MTRRRPLLIVVILVVLAAGLGSVPTIAQEPPQSCNDPNKQVTLYANEKGPRGRRLGYGRKPHKPRIPGPTIHMTEGDCVQVNLVNDSKEKAGLHFHGVDYTVLSDGTPHNKGCVGPGKSRTYVVSAHRPGARPDGTIDPGSAGYWHYHDHCNGTPHGTDGIRKGLFGGLIVRRAGDPRPDRRPFVVVFNGRTINGRRAPRTPIFKANIGERIEFAVIGHGNLMHTFHLHGHRWADTRNGQLSGVDDMSAVIDNKTLGPADSFGFSVIAGEHVGEGAWMYHCHVQGHSDAGMAGLLVVRGPDGKMSASTKAAVRRWKRIEGGGHH
ncbi:MAG: multicopper oxidase domain-containing protein [Actinobacteria bacterium]|nr:multicopper oxidase domain-containing protein [Actinomycetota bacterium]